MQSTGLRKCATADFHFVISLFVLSLCLFSCPGITERIKEEVVGSYAMPLIVAARIADKLSGSSLAPFYFCKYLVSMHDLLSSYKEMLKYCEPNMEKVVCSCLVCFM